MSRRIPRPELKLRIDRGEAASPARSPALLGAGFRKQAKAVWSGAEATGDAGWCFRKVNDRSHHIDTFKGV